MRTRYTARFQAQAWIHDYATNVDPEGPTEWDVTDAINSRFNGVPPITDDYPSDTLREEVNAPQWVKDWSGPFYIEVQEDGDATE